MPECVEVGSGEVNGAHVDDMHRYDGHAMTFALINAVKELSEQNSRLTARIEVLERLITDHGE
jgi:hypothetical protein